MLFKEIVAVYMDNHTIFIHKVHICFPLGLKGVNTCVYVCASNEVRVWLDS
jgi:hypothetical protein